jgi:hypothetical protein
LGARSRASLGAAAGVGEMFLTSRQPEDDRDYFRMPSVEATRLYAQAPSEGILVSALAQTLAGVEFNSPGAFELKGFEKPVEALSISWAPLAEETGSASRCPLSAVCARRLRSHTSGASGSAPELEDAVHLAQAGQRQVVCSLGRAGDRQDASCELRRARRACGRLRCCMGRVHGGTRQCRMSRGSGCAYGETPARDALRPVARLSSMPRRFDDVRRGRLGDDRPRRLPTGLFPEPPRDTITAMPAEELA